MKSSMHSLLCHSSICEFQKQSPGLALIDLFISCILSNEMLTTIFLFDAKCLTFIKMTQGDKMDPFGC